MALFVEVLVERFGGTPLTEWQVRLLAAGCCILFTGLSAISVKHATGFQVGLVAVLVAIGASLLLERVAFRPVRRASPNTMLITSFAVSALLQNLALLFVSARPKAVWLPAIFNENFQIVGRRAQGDPQQGAAQKERQGQQQS